MGYFFAFLLILNRVERIDLFPMKWAIFLLLETYRNVFGTNIFGNKQRS